MYTVFTEVDIERMRAERTKLSCGFVLCNSLNVGSYFILFTLCTNNVQSLAVLARFFFLIFF